MAMTMNRQQRRHQTKVDKQSLSINYGHNGQYVVVQLSKLTPHIVLSCEQVDDMIAALRVAKAELEKYVSGSNG